MKKQLINLTETTNYLSNPGCGWYTIYIFDAGKEVEKEKIVNSLREDESIALVEFDISAYKNMELPNVVFNHLSDILNCFYENGKDVIFRLLYDTKGHGKESEPVHFETVLSHVGKVASFMASYVHCVYIWQGLALGSWGEMHSTRFGTIENYQKIWKVIRDSLKDKDIFFAVRRPVLWRGLHTKSDFLRGNYENMGLFNDGIFGSCTDLGTYAKNSEESTDWDAPWGPKAEFEFAGKLCEKVPHGGEAVNSIFYANNFGTKETISRLASMKISYLNQNHDPGIIERWKCKIMDKGGIWQGKSLYDYIGTHLGYRYCIRRILIESGLIMKKLKISILIENIGFAPVYQETELNLYYGKSDEYRFKIKESDLRQCLPGKISCFKVVIPIVQGIQLHLSLEAVRKIDGRKILFANPSTKDGKVILYQA